MISTVLTILFIVAVLTALFWAMLNESFERTNGYSEEYLERVLGRIKIGGESLVGRFIGTQDGYDHYVIMTRNDDLNPPYQAVRTVQCKTCDMLVLPLSGCRCNVTQTPDKKWLKPCPIFNETAPFSFAHIYFVGYPNA